MILGSRPRRFTALRIAARSTTSGTPVKSCKTIRATTNGISSFAGCFAFHFASVSTSFRRAFFPSQFRKTDSNTIRMLTGNREIFPIPCSSKAGSEYKNPSCPAPAWNFVSVLNSSFMNSRAKDRKAAELRSRRFRCEVCALCVSSFQFRQLCFDLVEIRQLFGVVVALGILNHAVLVDDEGRTFRHSGHAEINLGQK